MRVLWRGVGGEVVRRGVWGAAALAMVLCMGSARVAHAQDTLCSPSEALDQLAVSRRSRSVLQTRDLYDRLHRTEQFQLQLATATHVKDDPPKRHYYFEWIGEISELGGYKQCTAEGLKPAGLAGGWNGFSIGVRDWSETPWSAQLFLVYTGDSMSPDDFIGDPNAEGPQFSDEILGTGQAIYGVTAQYTRWFAITLGMTQEARTLFDVQSQDTSGGGTTTSDRQVNSSIDLSDGAANRRFYLGLGVPEFHANVDLIVNTENTGLTYSFFGVRGFPMFFLDPNLTVTLGGGGYRFEDQILTEVGASYALFSGKLVPTVDAVFEWKSPRLRQARFRLDAALFGSWETPRGIFKDRSGFDLAGLLPWYAAGFGLYGEGSVYNSAYLERVTGQRDVAGWMVGGWARVSARIMTVGLDIFRARNRVETLTRLADSVGRPESGFKIHLRFGF